MEIEMQERFRALGQTAERLVEQGIQGDEVIVVETVNGNVYHFENHLFVEGKDELRFQDEEQFMKMLQEKNDCRLKYIVCMWNTGGVDVPSMHFRELLLEASPKNADAKFVVLTEDGNGGAAFGVRTIGWSMPAKKENE